MISPQKEVVEKVEKVEKVDENSARLRKDS